MASQMLVFMYFVKQACGKMLLTELTLRLLMLYIYIYIYIWSAYS